MTPISWFSFEFERTPVGQRPDLAVAVLVLSLADERFGPWREPAQDDEGAV